MIAQMHHTIQRRKILTSCTPDNDKARAKSRTLHLLIIQYVHCYEMWERRQCHAFNTYLHWILALLIFS